MSDNSSNNKRIAKNTLLLYIRMLFSLLVTLYTSRIVLNSLGIEDYGIFNVVGGVVTIFVFLNNAMVSASQRFISFEQGKGDVDSQRQIYSTSIVIHFLIALTVFVLSETIGILFLHTLNINPDRLFAAHIVYQSTIVVFCLNIIVVPFTATVIAHERMGIYAFVSILDTLLKLAVAYAISYYGKDRLILYSLLLIFIGIVNWIIYSFYVRKHFSECNFNKKIDWHKAKEMLSFAGWSFLGNFGFAIKDSGVNIIINLFFGVSVNAARGLATQVTNALNGFVTSFNTAVNPQIVKRYASNEIESMVSLVKSGSRYSFYLMSIAITLVIVRLPYILRLWLVEVPDYTEDFLRLSLVLAVLNSMYNPLVTAIQATGHIKFFQIIIAIIMCLEVPFAYVLLVFGGEPYNVVLVSMFIAVLALVTRLLIMSHYIKIRIWDFIGGIYLKNALLFCWMLTVPFVLNRFIGEDFFGFIFLCLLSLIWCILTIFVFGLNRKERYMVINYLKMKIDEYKR